MADDFGFFSSSESGAPEAAEEDPAAAFLAQQESEIAGIENDEGFGASAGSHAAPAQLGPTSGAGSEDMGTTVNGDVFREANGPADGYAAIAQADRLTQEPESIRKWREEQRKRLQELDAASKVTEQEWREKAKKDLEEWNQRQSEQVEKNKINNRASEEAFVKESKEETPGTEWEKVAQLCDFNPKSSKQCKDVSRLRSVLMSLKQTPLSR
ncbi:clathrin light chain B isoform X3 [Macaca nemestrina]|uniref:Clathrin light chain n=4 Tax=Cercopithecinae TaxID=9528 RepID=H9FPR5_MACMU|nr:clathrin light chain B isoform X2 [Macaca fascicularis]XP_008013562.1 clathrin light chain B isoform X2 [Chlorocebus sabaeus]XP_011738445.1 clathrin light chain B isoform X4 [Macaca nemestrina]XP_014996951.1 clathrin light chain B isoform X2 [Macaca mulatta]XP_050649239.1 clathrin light chain B isoform X2 [Macaca thibetana thibetana]